MKYVIIGSSAAGINAVRELRKYDREGEIVLVSKDENVYSRCILHQYLSGERTLERLNFAEPDFDTLYKVNWMKGREAIGLRPADHILVLQILEDNTVNIVARADDFREIATSGIRFEAKENGIYAVVNVA